jgi:hypothetical protein
MTKLALGAGAGRGNRRRTRAPQASARSFAASGTPEMKVPSTARPRTAALPLKPDGWIRGEEAHSARPWPALLNLGEGVMSRTSRSVRSGPSKPGFESVSVKERCFRPSQSEPDCRGKTQSINLADILTRTPAGFSGLESAPFSTNLSDE